MENPNNEVMVEKKPSKNVLGILSVIFAGVSLIGSWIPFLNVVAIILGFAAIVMGVISLVFVITKKTTVLALPIVGMSVGLISLILSFGVNALFWNLINNGSLDKITQNGTVNNIVSGSDNKEYKVGETVKLSNHELTVISVQRNFSTGNSYIAPASGNEFVKVTVKLENKTDGSINVNPYDFKVQDGNGAAGSPKSATFTLNDKFDTAQLAPNGSKTGSMVFEVPKGDKNLTLIYRLSSLVNKQIEIKL
ncbi:MAG: DUF4352 domain-containing protein [Clostridia bacterium]|nr:DUF4352 domain-containing protein [Clostridia bacterium]